MTKRIIIFVLILSTLLMCACANKAPADEGPSQTPAQTDTQDTASPSPSPSQETESPPPAPSVPAVRVSAELEDSYEVIAGKFNDGYKLPILVYLYADEPVCDLFVNEVIIRKGDTAEPAEELYTGGSLYVPELSPNQAVIIQNPYPYGAEDSDFYYTRIAYTNSAGEYEAVQLFGEADNNNPSVDFTEPSLSDKIYSEIHYSDEFYSRSSPFPEDFSEKMLLGDFDDYIPKGFCIMGGALGDVNGDGTQDALICLISAAAPVAAMYLSVVPLFVLIGQPDGGYVVEYKVADALFSPYRGSSRPVAGNGYIDIVYSYVGGAACNHTQIFRFLHNKAENDWLLEEFSYQSTYNFDYSEELPPEPVRPLPDFAGLPLEKLTGDEFYDSVPDWAYFDAVCDYAVPSYDTAYSNVYTLAVKLNKATGYYEGYIYQYYENHAPGGFIQTIRGEHSPGTELAVTANVEEGSFTVCGDVWKVAEYDSSTFHLAR